MLVRLLAFGVTLGVTPSDREPSNDRLPCGPEITGCGTGLSVSRSLSLEARFELWRWRREIGDEISEIERVI